MSTKVIPFPQVSRRELTSGESETASLSPRHQTETVDQRELRTVRVEGTAVLAPIPIDVLYPATESNRHELIRALQLLPQAVKELELARDAFNANDVLQSDHHVHAVQLLIPDLFRCRTIGDGFGAIVSALEIAFVNQRGEPLGEKQIITILRALKQLRSHPFVSFDSALQVVEDFEKVGLSVDPASLDELIDAAT
jgi:hypothetical protein